MEHTCLKLINFAKVNLAESVGFQRTNNMLIAFIAYGGTVFLLRTKTLILLFFVNINKNFFSTP